MMSIKVGIAGAAGRMGCKNCLSVLQARDMDLIGALEIENHAKLGVDIGNIAGIDDTGVNLTDKRDNAFSMADVIIDFTAPDATIQNLEFCRKMKIAMVIGTTGLTQEQLKNIEDIATDIPIVFAPNMSLGVNLLFKITDIVARALGHDYDCEIVEAHHNKKADAPSGTAMRIAEIIARVLEQDIDKTAVYGRHGIPGPRKKDEIGILALRGGDIVGEHTVYFAGQGERIELIHRAHNRETFANGAVRAARWIVGQPAGLYSMQDVLGI